MMKSQNLLAIVTVGLLLLISSMLSQKARGPVQLRLEPSSGGTVKISLLNRSRSPVKFYDSLRNKRANQPPGFTTIRLRDAEGGILVPVGAQSDGFWTFDITHTKRVPVILDTLQAKGTVEVATDLKTLLEDFPDQSLLQRATTAQVRCVVFLDKGVLDERTGWLPLDGVKEQ